MKTKENAETVNKTCELTDEDLTQVSGGAMSPTIYGKDPTPKEILKMYIIPDDEKR